MNILLYDVGRLNPTHPNHTQSLSWDTSSPQKLNPEPQYQKASTPIPQNNPKNLGNKTKMAMNQYISQVDNIPIMQLLTRIPRNTLSEPCMLPLTE